jgi:radical SAM superfamily enzyme YgiQ (UPF0313 family)
MMKIGMIAMSGVRAASDELNRAGLTMPGVVERGKVVASMPTLSLLTLAALTPRDIEVEYREIKDLRAEPALPQDFDLVAIATQSAQVLDAYSVADHYRAQGVPVVMGGLHVTTMPDEALAHASAVVIGEAEGVWARLVNDWRSGQLARIYRATKEFDLANAPLPRYDLINADDYNRLLVQTSRGCPHQCEFCASSILLTKRYKVKPVDRIIAEVRQLKQHWRRPFLEFADDNSFIHRAQAHALMDALKPERVRWFTECDISIANDVALLDMMRDAGCRQILIGLESPTPSGLDGVERRANWKLRQITRYESAVRTIQSRGIAVNGCFVLGLDGDTPEVFDAVYDFAQRVGLFDVQITVLTPFPGTPLYARLAREGRIIAPGAWNTCTLFDVNFEPRNMSADHLQRGLVALAQRLYDPIAVAQRRERFFEQVRAGSGILSPALEEERAA